MVLSEVQSLIYNTCGFDAFLQDPQLQLTTQQNIDLYTVIVAYSLDMIYSAETVKVLLRNNLLMRCVIFCDKKQIMFSGDVRDVLGRFYERF